MRTQAYPRSVEFRTGLELAAPTLRPSVPSSPRGDGRRFTGLSARNGLPWRRGALVVARIVRQQQVVQIDNGILPFIQRRRVAFGLAGATVQP
jgi:hypothetical protein